MKLIRERVLRVEKRNSVLDSYLKCDVETGSIFSSTLVSSSMSNSSSLFNSFTNLNKTLANATANETTTTEFDFFNFQLPKHDFFLYSIQEHSKTFNNKKFSIKRKLANLKNLSMLSKSEPSLAPIKKEKIGKTSDC